MQKCSLKWECLAWRFCRKGFLALVLSSENDGRLVTFQSAWDPQVRCKSVQINTKCCRYYKISPWAQELKTMATWECSQQCEVWREHIETQKKEGERSRQGRQRERREKDRHTAIRESALFYKGKMKGKCFCTTERDFSLRQSERESEGVRERVKEWERDKEWVSEWRRKRATEE